jgi:uncharacterized protein (TIGR03118 family)
MQKSALFRTTLLAAGVVASLGSGIQPAEAAYVQTNLVSDIPGLAIITDPNLQNPWGISRSPTSPFWVSNQETNTTTLYRVTGATDVQINPGLQVVSIPTTGGGPQGPTGQVFNSGSNFDVGGQSARFIFANLNGTISAWNQTAGTTAVTRATTPDAVYTGLAINNDANRLYAANVAGGGSIDVFDASFTLLSPSGFSNPFPGLVPFNVQNINGDIYVMYAPSGLSAMQQAQEGSGAVAIFDQNGEFKQTLIDVGRELASPWGLALAPAGFGEFGGDLLVGDFSFVESEINAFDPLTGAFEGTIPIDPGAGNTPGGLWGLIFGNGSNGGDPNVLYVANGINGEENGLFLAISVAVPEPSSVLLLAAALSLLGAGYGIARRGA